MSNEDLAPLILMNTKHILVLEAAIRALIAAHPAPSEVERVTRLLLMQMQSRVAASAVQAAAHSPHFGDHEQQILDALFRPPIVLPPNE